MRRTGLAAALVLAACTGAATSTGGGRSATPPAPPPAGQHAERAARPAGATRSPLAVAADSLFWRTLHAGAYDSIPRAMLAIKAAYLENPRDHVTAAHAGFLHAWRATERARLARLSPSLVDDIVLARRYFDRALALDPAQDARVHGFAATFRVTEGSVLRDEALVAEGRAAGHAAVARWPEFNLFTVGYAASALPDTSAAFREALAMQWRTTELCRGAAPPAADAWRRRACVNTWIAPHNLEGFYLNLGDMLVKSGDPAKAREVYGWARALPSYGAWPYRAVLEARIADAERNVAAFRVPEARGPAVAAGDPTRRVMVRTPFACAGCHQAR